MTKEVTQADLDSRRLKSCVENWSEASSGEYNPYCCRFPKSCSPHGYIEAVEAGNLTEDDLESEKASFVQATKQDFHPGTGWRLKEEGEYVTNKHVLLEWSADAAVRRIWVEDQ